jgi:hypothetical protein
VISYIQIKDRKLGFKTSVLAIRDFAHKKNVKFEDAFEIITNAGFEDIVSLWHSSISTVPGQDDITEDNIWQWVDEDENISNKLMEAVGETMPKNLFRPA